MKFLRRLLPALALTAATLAIAASAQTSPISAFAGAYGATPSQYVVAPMDVHGNLFPLFLRTDTGELRFLKPVDDKTYAFGNALLDFAHRAGSVRFDASGMEVTSGQSVAHARRISIAREDVVFENGSAKLAGTLFLPESRGKNPAVVLMHGSGPETRDAAGVMPYLFASIGYVVLTYDQRGSGESTGSLDSATYDDLVADGLSAIRYLKTRAEVNSRSVGAWGPSQGGMLAILMAARSSDVDFVIDQSGYFTPTWQAQLYELQTELHVTGLTSRQIDEATRFQLQKYRVAQTGKGWPEFARLMLASRTKPWAGHVYMPRSLSDLQERWTGNSGFDPVPAAALVRCPILALYGSLDRSSPMPQSATNLRKGLAHNTAAQIVVFPGVNHEMLDAKTGYDSETPTLRNYDVGYLTTLVQWLQTSKRSVSSTDRQ